MIIIIFLFYDFQTLLILNNHINQTKTKQNKQ